MLEQRYFGRTWKNPILVSSGCFGFGLEYRDYFDPNLLGGISLKGITLEPRQGNLGRRLMEMPAGLLNCVGLENPGIEVFSREILPELRLSGMTTNFIANINGSSLEDYVEIAKRVDALEEIAVIELNISCPNVKAGGMAFGARPEMAEEVTRAVRAVTTKPLVVKLSPNVTDIVEIALRVERAGADGISLINTLLGMAIDVKKKAPVLGNTFGGLSGAAVKAVALRMLYQVYEAVKIPIIGMGGITEPQDALEFLMAGASLISIGTGIFRNPYLAVETEAYLRNYCLEEGLENISEIVGIAHRR